MCTSRLALATSHLLGFRNPESFFHQHLRRPSLACAQPQLYTMPSSVYCNLRASDDQNYTRRRNICRQTSSLRSFSCQSWGLRQRFGPHAEPPISTSSCLHFCRDTSIPSLCTACHYLVLHVDLRSAFTTTAHALPSHATQTLSQWPTLT